MPASKASPRPRSRATASRLRFDALSPQRWDDLVRLFGPNGACGGCWCMWFKRDAAQFARGKGAGNKRAFKRTVDRGDEPGFLGYLDGEPVAWCAVEPREHYPLLARSRSLAPVDEQPVWSVTCFFIKAGYRNQGLSQAMLAHAKKFAAARGARLIEGYPKDVAFQKGWANALWNGLASTFLDAGFTEVARRSPRRPIMRARLRRAAPARKAARTGAR